MKIKDMIAGFIIGVFAPIIAFVVYIIFYRGDGLLYFFNYFVTDNNFPAMISLSLLINLLLFFIYINFDQDEKSRGILLSTILYGFLIIILKYL